MSRGAAAEHDAQAKRIDTPPMHTVDLFILLPALAGHVTLWIEFVNHVHATGMPRWMIIGLTKLGYGALLLVPPAIAWRLYSGAMPQGILNDPWSAPPALLYYLAICCTAALVVVPAWCRHRFAQTGADVLFKQRSATSRIDEQLGIRPSGSLLNRLLLRVPGNQSYQLVTSEKELIIPRMDSALDGFVIAHLSDLHFTGCIDKAYFQEIIRRTNRMGADMVVVTGDLVDHAPCIEWIPDTLARLESRWGTYFVLGNHDRRVNLARLREALDNAGMIDLGGRLRILNLGDRHLLLAGNELPWIGPAAEKETAIDETQLRIAARILLSHTPDQYEWARSRGFDLMLAGHTHGGQIVFPLVGPLVVPSRFGAKYAAGVFYEPPTVMHVSRGLSSQHPIRLNCPPELVRLVLRAPKCVVHLREAANAQEGGRATRPQPLPVGMETA